VVLFTGCSGETANVPTLADHEPSGVSRPSESGTPGTTLDTIAGQHQSAEKLANCLDAQGIDATTEEIEVTGYQGRFLIVMPQPKSDRFAVRVPGSMGMASADFPHDIFDDDGKAMLIDGDQDLTSVFEACIASAEYFVPQAKFDAAEEEISKQLIVEASNEWATCARRIGMPGILDARVSVDNWETVPSAVIPAATDQALFREVLEQCPPVNPKREIGGGNLFEESGDEIADPAISVEPGDDPRAEGLIDLWDQEVVAIYDSARR
jgi:hypothetical protein